MTTIISGINHTRFHRVFSDCCFTRKHHNLRAVKHGIGSPYNGHVKMKAVQLPWFKPVLPE